VLEFHGLTLDPFQEQAIRAIESGHSILVAAPTGAGKTLIAEYALEKCLAAGRRVVYTAPIKALSNQKYRDFSARYGDRIGIKTGDVSINPGAPVCIMTTEIFRNTLFESPEAVETVDTVIFDEIHYLDDAERGTVWEESLIFAPPHIHFVCLSATVSNVETFARWLGTIRRDRFEVVREDARPVPLEHLLVIPGKGAMDLEAFERLDRTYREPRRHHAGDHAGRRLAGDDARARKELLSLVQERGLLPCLYFAFNRRECEALAKGNLWRNLLTPAESAEAAAQVDALARRYDVTEDPAALDVRALLVRGIAYHHAGLLPTLKETVERLFTTGLVKLLFATETFALGVNMPAKAVAFDTLHKFDGVRRSFILTREYLQMAGRAGRRGMDATGTVLSRVEWPFVRSPSVRRVVAGQVEPIVSRFNLSYATILNLYGRLGDRLFEAAEKSFSNYTAAGGAKVSTHAFGEKVRLLRRRLQVLRDLGYLRERELTAKGRLASQIYGYELQLAELVAGGVLDGLDPSLLNVVVAATVFEARRGTWYDAPDAVPRFSPLKKRSLRIVGAIRQAELARGVEPPVKHLDYRLSAVVHAWSTGATFDALRDMTSASDGDLVRSLRQAIQLLRQVAFAVAGPRPELAARLREGVRLLRRDVVDAERQLRMPPEEEKGAKEGAAGDGGAGSPEAGVAKEEAVPGSGAPGPAAAGGSAGRPEA
jgi:superfamily II RNA helicase